VKITWKYRRIIRTLVVVNAATWVASSVTWLLMGDWRRFLLAQAGIAVSLIYAAIMPREYRQAPDPPYSLPHPEEDFEKRIA
jgi:hypothetical protein